MTEEEKKPSQWKQFMAIEAKSRLVGGRKRSREKVPPPPPHEKKSRKTCRSCEGSGDTCDGKRPCAACATSGKACDAELASVSATYEVVSEELTEQNHNYLIQKADGIVLDVSHENAVNSKPFLAAIRRWRERMDRHNPATLSAAWKKKYFRFKKRTLAEIAELKDENGNLRTATPPNDDETLRAEIATLRGGNETLRAEIATLRGGGKESKEDDALEEKLRETKEEAEGWRVKFAAVASEKALLEKKIMRGTHVEEARLNHEDEENSKALKETTKWLLGVGGSLIDRSRKFLAEAADLKKKDDKKMKELANRVAAASQKRAERAAEMYTGLRGDVKAIQDRMRDTESTLSELMDVSVDEVPASFGFPFEKPPTLSFGGQEFPLPNLEGVSFDGVELPLNFNFRAEDGSAQMPLDFGNV